MGLFGRRKKELLVWQNLIMQDAPNKLIMSEKQLKQLSKQQASNDLRIIQDCLKIISNTVMPATFFSRLDLLKEKSKHLMLLEPYITFSGASPTAAYKEMLDQEQQAIYLFICRFFNCTFEKAETLKTEKGRKNHYQKFFDSLEPYTDRMDEHNLNYIESKRRKLLK